MSPSYDIDKVKNSVDGYFTEIGCEVHYFKIGWYNDIVNDVFKLPFDHDTLACVIISTPSMFEKAFIPFVQKHHNSDNNKFERDPLDECLNHHFNKAKNLVPDTHVEVLKDYELLPSRRPKVLVQTAAHVSGAAYYYQDTDVLRIHTDTCPAKCNKIYTLNTENTNKENTKFKNEIITDNGPQCICERPWPPKKKMFGVCIHPLYGGWFAIRGVMIFKGITQPSLAHKPSIDVVDSRELRIELLKRFNGNWKDWTYRDIIPTQEKYSDMQKKYFITLPKHRLSILNEIISL